MIFEDDLSIDDIPAFDRLVDALTRQCNRWDIVKLSGTRRRTLPVPEARVDKKHVLAVPLLKTTGACCYMINRRGAEIIPKALEPFTDHFDHQLDQPWRFGLRYRIVHPFPVREAAFGSTIDYSHRCAKFRAWDRRYALYYRFRTGLRRLGYNARHGFFASSLVSYFTG